MEKISFATVKGAEREWNRMVDFWLACGHSQKEINALSNRYFYLAIEGRIYNLYENY